MKKRFAHLETTIPGLLLIAASIGGYISGKVPNELCYTVAIFGLGLLGYKPKEK